MTKIVTIALDKERHLKFDYNALADVEERAGLGIGAIFTTERIGLHMIRILLWAGLKWEDRKLSPQKVGELIGEYLNSGGELDELVGKVTEAVENCGLFGKSEQGNMKAEAAN